MKKIPLSQGKYALVDDDMFDELNQFKWHAIRDGYTFYVARKAPNKTEKRRQRTVLMHRAILNPEKDQICDHIDRNGLDNRRSNLRIASRSLNNLNQRIYKNNTSGFKGVHWHKQRGKWRARININNKRKHLGLFDTAKEASICYQKAFKIRMTELTT